MTQNSIVTLTSEYGNKSPYAAIIKGKLLTNNPGITIIDFTNEVRRNDILSASYIIKTASIHYPPNTIHLIAVDFNIISHKNVLIVKYKDMYFVGADNGIFSLLFKGLQIEVYAFDLSQVKVHHAFPEMDILPYITQKLIANEPLNTFAVPAQIGTIRELLTPAIHENTIKGTVIFVDGYENAITDITTQEFDELKSKYATFRLFFRRKSDIRLISDSYIIEKEGEALALFNSNGHLEIAIKDGHAKSLLGLEMGSNIIIEFYD